MKRTLTDTEKMYLGWALRLQNTHRAGDGNVNVYYHPLTGNIYDVGAGSLGHKIRDREIVRLRCDEKGILPIIWTNDGVRRDVPLSSGLRRVLEAVREYRSELEKD